MNFDPEQRSVSVRTFDEQLGDALEILVQQLSRIDARLLPRRPTELYEAVSILMVRLAFSLRAPFDTATTLREKLRDTARRRGEESLERDFDAWPRLSTCCRTLFAPGRFPFLDKIRLDDRTVLTLLTALEQVEHGDIERIGHVYESLLEYSLKRLDEPVLGFAGAKGAGNSIIALPELESAKLEGEETLVALIRERTKKNVATIRRRLDAPVEKVLETNLDAACFGDGNLVAKVKPLANLLRLNAWGRPAVFVENSLIVAPGPNRRDTGTHYTPKSLTEKIVRTTLEPLVYDGREDGKPLETRTIKKPHEILSLKICDPTLGSGAFLVQICRWLGDRLVESWDAEKKNGSPIDDRTTATARRLVAEHCLYGVDIDPAAVELAKRSIRLVAASDEYPCEGLDRHLRCGDSLPGECAFSWTTEFPGVFSRVDPGFDAIVGNPPFLGGRKMRKTLGDAFVEQMKKEWPHASLNADLCVFFFLRSSTLLRKNGVLGLLAPDTIAQGDTARTGLVFLTERSGFSIGHAVSSFRWPGKARVVASWIVLRRERWQGKRILNGKAVERISSVLDEGGSWGDTPVFPENREINFQGSVLAGEGFVLSRDEAERYLGERKSNADVIFPYLGGYDLKSTPTFEATRWVVDFRDFPLERCEQEWPELLERVRRLVKPERDRANRAAHRRYWWHHGDKRPALYDRIRRNEFVFALVRHAKHLAPARVSTRQVFQESLCLLDLPNWTAFAAIQSTLHYVWAKRGSSTLGEGLRYTPSDYFDTFPFLHLRSEELEKIGAAYDSHRLETMGRFDKGLTHIYNRFHRPDDSDRRIEELRELHRRMDEATCAAYGWEDLKLNHDFHQVPYLPANDRVRFTISEQARGEVLRRLADLCRTIERTKDMGRPRTEWLF